MNGGCGCRVEQTWPPVLEMGRDAEGRSVGTAPAYRIVYCPLHAAAERMAGLVETTVKRLGHPDEGGGNYVGAMRDFHMAARALLAEIGR